MMIPAASASEQRPNSSCYSTGKERDAETGLDCFEARYMSSAQGRFSIPDSHMGVPGNPQSWNKYTYTFNNPLALVDPEGHFPTPAHIQWTAAGLQSLGFSNAQAFATVVNSTVDRKFFRTDCLHAMSGDSAYQGGRWGFLSIAASARNPAESAVALVLGMHLVEDYAGHQGITSILGHILKYGFGDTDPNSQAGKTAQGNTQKFLDDFMSLLIANLGEAGAQEFILKMQANAERLTAQAHLAKKSPSLVYDYINAIYDQMVFSQTRVNGQAPTSHAEEEAQRQCALGNPATCVQ